MVVARATDALGNPGASPGRGVSVGNAAPPIVPPTASTNTAPAISALRPAAGSSTRDATPRISATAKDAQGPLGKAAVGLYVDGRRVPRFSYDPASGKLSYTSKNLKPGRHSVRVETRDEQGLVGKKAWSFKVVRRR